MPEERVIAVEDIDQPENFMRVASIHDDWDAFKESIATHGLLVPILVRRCGARYRLIAGVRRTLAHQELKIPTIRAMVYDQGEEIDEEMVKAHENFHRSDLNPIEEGEYYTYLASRYGISNAEIARRCRRQPARVAALMAAVGGDPNVKDALGVGEISLAQAIELNKVRDELGRAQALEWARRGHMNARALMLWREHREMGGVDENSEEIARMLTSERYQQYRTQAECYFCRKWEAVEQCLPRSICEGCMAILGSALELYQEKLRELDSEGKGD